MSIKFGNVPKGYEAKAVKTDIGCYDLIFTKINAFKKLKRKISKLFTKTVNNK